MKHALMAILIGVIILVAAAASYSLLNEGDLFSADLQGKLHEYREETATKAGLQEEDIVQGDLLGEFVPRLISLSLQVFGAALLVMIVISGIYLVAGGTNESLVEEAKSIFYHAIIGAVVVTISFALVYGVTQVNWTGS